MNLKLSNELNEILSYSREESMRMGSYSISADHLIMGILRHQDNSAFETIIKFGVDYKVLKEKIEGRVRIGEMVPFEQANKISLSEEAERSIKLMYLEAKVTESDSPTPLHLLLAILRGGDAQIIDILKSYNITYERIRATLKEGEEGRIFTAQTVDDESFRPNEEKNAPPSKDSLTIKKSSKTPVVDSFGLDLNEAAREGRLDPVVGRKREIERVSQILGRRKKNNPVIIGEPGVGKSAIAEGLAQLIVKKEVPRALLDKRIVALDIGSIVAGTKYRGQFEERIKAILNELRNNREIILFIDEIHTLVGAGGATGSLDAANMLKPALARGDIQCIGATTLDEYREHIEKDGALERRFQKILVDPTNYQETYEILSKVKERYEEHHNVTYTDSALVAAIKLSQRYITDRNLPDKAIDAIDEAGSRVHLRSMHYPPNLLAIEQELESINKKKRERINLHNIDKAAELRELEREKREELEQAIREWKEENVAVVDEQEIATVLSLITNVPVERIAQKEGERLSTMGEEIRKRIIGQDEAVDKIVRAIQRNRAGLKDPNKPIGTFLFLGPTGVGKTQLAKVLASYLFDSEDNLIRVDMSEYMEKFALSRLIGAPPGYVGYDEGGELSEKVRRRPYSVVLLDEIEKAHPDIFNILLQVLDEGRLTDSNGRHIDFRNTLLIMTSNVGSRELKEFGSGMGFSTVTKRNSEENSRFIIEKVLNRTFAPEFLNRLDEQILFNTLTKENIYQIVDIELRELYRRANEAGYRVELSKEAKSFVADKGFDPQFGARPLKRAIQSYIEDLLAEAIVGGEFKIGERISIEVDKEGLKRDESPQKLKITRVVEEN